MSTLIKELEARKDDYVLVADVINVLGNVTNSKPHEVVKYLDASKIDEHLSLLYMDESYSFELYNGYILGLGNDANITYYQKSDVMAFEPIAKHGIFKDGSNDLINPYQKNLDDEYLTMDEVVANLNNRAGLSCDYDKIRDLARKRKITPCFYFNGYVCELSPDQSGELSPCFFETPHTEIMTGYFTYRLLVEQISSYDEYITLPHCEMGNEILIYRLLERQGDTQISYGDALALFESRPQPFDDRKNYSNRFGSIGFEEIRFSKQELDGYIASLEPVVSNNSYGKSLQDSELLTKLETAQAENSDLNARLFTARNTYKQNQSEIKDLKAQLEKANADSAFLKEQFSNKIDVPDSIDELKGIAKLNVEKPIFINSAKAIADYLWSLDKSEAIRTGDMVQQIKMIMRKADDTLMPDDDDTIRNWLSKIAPPHAKKSGRTPKDAPSEITLTMKK